MHQLMFSVWRQTRCFVQTYRLSMSFVKFYCIYIGDTVSALSEVISYCWTWLGLLFLMSNILMTAEDVVAVALDWCVDDDTSYEEEQKHKSGDDVAVPAIIRPHQLSSSSDEEDSSNEEVDACTRNSRSVLAASSAVYGKKRTAWTYSSSSSVGRILGHNIFTDWYLRCTHANL